MPPLVSSGAGHHSFNIEKLQAGNPEHFQRLYKAYCRTFLIEAHQLLIQKEEAASIVNHSFIKCWLRSEALTSKEYFFAFLRTSINKNSYECNNSKSYKSQHQDKILQIVLSNANFSGKSPKELLAEILSLPEAQTAGIREVFRLRYGRSMTMTEIAEETGLNAEEIEASLNLAYKMLHVILSEELF